MATQVFKDPYLFDFLGTADLRRERELNTALIDHIRHSSPNIRGWFRLCGSTGTS